jgi:hypothetical protein
VVNVGGLDEPMPAWNLALSIHDRGMRREALGTAFAAMVESDPAGGDAAAPGAAARGRAASR